MRELHCGTYRLRLDRPLLMGIVNLTPDSFSGDGLAANTRQAIAHAQQQWQAGADILDIGAESSRPGAQATPEDEELRRLLPVLQEVCRWGIPVSVDTYKPKIMQAALAAGASMINDIRGARDHETRALIAASDCALCLMHMQGAPASMQDAPVYADVCAEVSTWLRHAASDCQNIGIARERLLLDPGFGFGKTLAHNLALFNALKDDIWQGLPLLVGVSRKRMLGEITGRPVHERQAASIAAALLAAQRGAAMLRVHDVAATRDALAVWAAVENT
ncbi:dihydropteroate synthase [Azonexus sp.]|uniref:dihydropteroate synthase n=1 Tax=Azonexus sp. TaxID=1872668 RepID=UPI0039E24D0E